MKIIIGGERVDEHAKEYTVMRRNMSRREQELKEAVYEKQLFSQ
ncbi:MAG: hypothetical protein QW842_06475 [Candidatus Nezhaarchaeales archaeon]